MTMFIAGFLLNRRRERVERRQAALRDLVAPPVEHPQLGIGGRSIELSEGLDRIPSADAVILAADTFHELVLGLQTASDPRAIKAARSDGAFLSKAAEKVAIPQRVRRRLVADTGSLANLT